jgi:hypothetical protein
VDNRFHFFHTGHNRMTISEFHELQRNNQTLSHNLDHTRFFSENQVN